MIHNQHNLLPGDIVNLDIDKANTSKVRIVSITPQGMYSRVHKAELENPTDKDCWDVMTARLSHINEPEEPGFYGTAGWSETKD